MEMSESHKPGRIDETERIKQAGGWITEEKELYMGRLHRMDLSDPLVSNMMACWGHSCFYYSTQSLAHSLRCKPLCSYFPFRWPCIEWTCRWLFAISSRPSSVSKKSNTVGAIAF